MKRDKGKGLEDQILRGGKRKGEKEGRKRGERESRERERERGEKEARNREERHTSMMEGKR
jgi:hypothetical protein